MPARLLAGGLAAATALAALPAAAHAAQRAVVAGPIAVHGYQLSVLGVTGAPTLTVMLERDQGTTTQAHLYSVRRGAHVSAKRIRADLGSLGAIDLRLARGGAARLPDGCRGEKTRTGTWRGSLRLAADTTFFHTISASRLPGTVLRTSSLECDEPGAPTSPAETGAQLVTSGSGASIAADATATTVLDTTRRGRASVVHVLTTPSTLTAATDLTTATLTPTGTAITGSARFTGSVGAATIEDGPTGTTSRGTLAGTLVAHFDSIGDVTVGPSLPAILEQMP
jgi:hypothetical protein